MKETAPKGLGKPAKRVWRGWWRGSVAPTWDDAEVESAYRLIRLIDAYDDAEDASAQVKLNHEIRQGERRLRLTMPDERVAPRSPRPPLEREPQTPQQELAALTEGLVQDPLNPGWWR